MCCPGYGTIGPMTAEHFADITYRGLDLGTRLRVLELDESWVRVEHPAPMPVGTELALVLDSESAVAARVTRVYEQVAGADTPPGMHLALLQPIEQARPAEEPEEAPTEADAVEDAVADTEPAEQASSETESIATAPTRELDLAMVAAATAEGTAAAATAESTAAAVTSAGEAEPEPEPEPEPESGTFSSRPTQTLNADEVQDALREHIEAANLESPSESSDDGDSEEAALAAADKSKKKKRRKKRARTRGA